MLETFLTDLRYDPLLRLAGGVLAALALAALTVRTNRDRHPVATRTILRSLTLVGSLAIAVVVAELALFAFFTESHGACSTLASRRWFQRYWHPVNASGYRDFEHDPADFVEKKTLCVLGDSYVAGQGIENVVDRFGNILATSLGTDWTTINVAKLGWDTMDELKALRSLKQSPDVVVLSYCLNDIDRAAARHGLTPTYSQVPKPDAMIDWINKSALVNLIWSRLRGPLLVKSVATDYFAYLRSAYLSEMVWRDHAQELDALVTHCREHQIELVAVVLPLLLDVEASKPMTTRVASWFTSHHVPTVDMTDHLIGRDPRDLIINPFDPHANEAVNAEIAEHLLEILNHQTHFAQK